nr:hypothetical protein [Tanacetum cinerariifolium]
MFAVLIRMVIWLGNYSLNLMYGLVMDSYVDICHEKVVRTSLEGDEILRVQGEHTQGLAKTLLNTKKGRVKLRRVRAMSITIQSSVKDEILATPSETSKVENALAEMLRDLDQQMEKRADDGSEIDEAHASGYLVHPRADKTYYNLGDMYWWP